MCSPESIKGLITGGYEPIFAAAIGGLITRGFDYLPVMYSGWSTYEILGPAYKETEAREETVFQVEPEGTVTERRSHR